MTRRHCRKQGRHLAQRGSWEGPYGSELDSWRVGQVQPQDPAKSGSVRVGKTRPVSAGTNALTEDTGLPQQSGQAP